MPAGSGRPRWSVMIPTYNCARYLRQTLASVLSQDPAPGGMQIEVVDDASTSDDPESIVRELGKGRVTFYRKSLNEGAIANFNTCLSRSRGSLVHILHGDDFVAPGFYSRLGAAIAAHPDTSAFFVRCRIVQEDGTLDTIADRMHTLACPTRSAREIYYTNALYTPGVVVRRSFYERHGGFLPDLLHCADCEMWARAISNAGGLWLNELLASYRSFGGNDTNRLARSAENIRDRVRLALLFADRFEDFDLEFCLRIIARTALRQMQRFAMAKDPAGVEANRRAYCALAPLSRRLLLRLWDREIGINPVRAQRNGS
ncbi:MAG: glycosyltransferase [Acidobacteriota bacterium]